MYIRNVIAIVVAVILFGLIPIYDLPFSRCDNTGFYTAEITCSWWIEFLRGFLFLAALVIFSTHKRIFAGIGVGVILAVVLTGGANTLFAGVAFSYFRNNYMEVYSHISNPLLIGALSSALFFLICFGIYRRKSSDANA